MSEWIKCSDSLPSERESWDETSTINVLAIHDDGQIEIAFWSYELLCWCDFIGDEIEEDEYGAITHWMPLPEPPK